MSQKPDILQEQIAYYRARAAEYDEWFYRQGRYNQGEEENQRWFTETEQVRQQLLQLPKQQHALEIACGTGIWTQELLHVAEHITALDAAPEMIAINKAKVQSERVAYQQMDIFEWQPTQQYDMVFFGFWLSHVPNSKLDAFLVTVAKALKPDGIVFIVDGQNTKQITAHNQQHPENGEVMQRVLNDGRHYDIIKIYYAPSYLDEAFAKRGINFATKFTDKYMLYGSGVKQEG